MKINSLAILASFILLLSACQKESVPSPSSDDFDFNKVDYKDGRVVFDNTNDYLEAIDWIRENKSNDEKIIDAFSNVGLSESMYTLNLEMDKMESPEAAAELASIYPNAFYPAEFDNSIIYELQGPLTYSYFSNKDGLYQVGNVVYRITFDKQYSQDISRNSDISSLLNPPTETNEVVTVNSILESDAEKGQYSYRTSYFSSKHRLVARLYRYAHMNPGDVHEWQARSTSQKRWAGVWWQKNIYSISLAWPNSNLVAVVNGRSITYNIPAESHAKLNASNIRESVWGAAMVGASFFAYPAPTSSAVVTHRGNSSGTVRFITGEIF